MRSIPNLKDLFKKCMLEKYSKKDLLLFNKNCCLISIKLIVNIEYVSSENRNSFDVN